MSGLPPYLDSVDLDRIIRRAIDEDLGPGDVTTSCTIPEDSESIARFVAKETGVLAGTVVAERVFHLLDPALAVEWRFGDGAKIEAGITVGTVSGQTHSLLAAERVALNFLQRMSGIATAAAAYVDSVAGTRATILDTRKTVPGLRLLDKWAVLAGGADNHRTGLFDMILIKDNHIAAAGGIRQAVASAVEYARTHNLKIEVEAKTLEEVEAVLAAPGVDRVLLDNMVDVSASGDVDVSRLRTAVKIVGGRLETEASGNVTLRSVRAIAETGVDFISSGALTHSVRALDLSLLIDPV